MNFFDKFQNGLEKVVGPFATAVGKSKYIQALTEGFMYSMPLTLGVALIAVLANLPIEPWTQFLKNTGMYSTALEVVSLTLSLLAVYVVGAIGYAYTKKENEKGIIGAIIALASFIVLIPVQRFTTEQGKSVSTLATSYLGSDGIFLAIILGLAVPSLYCWLMKKNLRLKLPDSVPPMVSQSLAPTFVTMIIFTTIFVIKYACTFTPYGNLFTLVSTLIGKPIAAFGANPVSLIIVFTLMNLIWFFGVHPNAILMPYMPILTLVNLANQEAFLAGNALPYLTFAVVATCVQIGGAGNTLGLCIASFFAKSEKYKAMRKLVRPANIFNINEPVIFGFPVMLNPLYFFPMVFSPAIVGLITYGLCQIFTFNINPTIAMPWVTPGFVTAFFQGGLSLLLVWILAVFIDFILYLPFFLIDDKNTLKLEQENTK